MSDLTNEELYQKYKKMFAYTNKMIYNYLRDKKNKDNFKRISMDYDDIKQEVHIGIVKILRKYEDKYKDIDKVSLKVHVRDTCNYIIKHLLRDHKNEIFFPMGEDEYFELINKRMRTKFTPDEEELAQLDSIVKKDVIHPDLITQRYKESLNEDDIKEILKSCNLSKEDYKVLEMKIIYNYTLQEIKDTLGLKSRQVAQEKIKRAIMKLKSKYKEISQLFDR